jgi:hypothetical protein
LDRPKGADDVFESIVGWPRQPVQVGKSSVPDLSVVEIKLLQPLQPALDLLRPAELVTA